MVHCLGMISNLRTEELLGITMMTFVWVTDNEQEPETRSWTLEFLQIPELSARINECEDFCVSRRRGIKSEESFAFIPGIPLRNEGESDGRLMNLVDG